MPELQKNNVDIEPGDTFDVGSKVERNGLYVCAPCGNKQRFRRNQRFPRCFSCMKNQLYEDDEYIKDLGLWEFIEE